MSIGSKVNIKPIGVAFAFVFALLGCGGRMDEGASLIGLYGADADYYLALLARREGKEDEAAQLFERCASSGNSIAAERSMTEVTRRHNALQSDSEHKEGEVKSSNVAVYSNNTIGDDGTVVESTQETDVIKLLHGYVSSRQYAKAYLLMNEAKAYIDVHMDEAVSPILSDMGKAALYASEDKSALAVVMDDIADKMAGKAYDKKAVYIALFYAARLYSMAGNRNKARSKFLEASNKAVTGVDSDNALWYLLSMEMNNGIDAGLGALKVNEWHDASYFDDLLEVLSQKLLASGRWLDHARVCAMLLSDKDIRHDAYTACEAVAQYAYIYARLVEEGLVAEGVSGLPSVKSAMGIALDGGADRYYRVLAIAKLGLEGEAADKAMLHTAVRVADISLTANSALGGEHSQGDKEKFLMGFADFGLTDMIYSEWQAAVDGNGGNGAGSSSVSGMSGDSMTVCESFYPSVDCAVHLATSLEQAGYTEQGLRIVSRTAGHNDTPYITREALECLFPQGNKEDIEESSKKYGMNAAYAFALIRSESFFNSNAISTAGAVGLTQLMPSTARDIARVLKMDDADLNDSKVNIAFGLKYLSDLLDRVGVPLLAFLSYNTGLTRVRRYVKDNNASRMVRGAGGGSGRPLPLDLLLEVLPYQETRGYGRKLVSAAAVYGYLYYNTSVQSTVREIFETDSVHNGEEGK